MSTPNCYRKNGVYAAPILLNPVALCQYQSTVPPNHSQFAGGDQMKPHQPPKPLPAAPDAGPCGQHCWRLASPTPSPPPPAVPDTANAVLLAAPRRRARGGSPNQPPSWTPLEDGLLLKAHALFDGDCCRLAPLVAGKQCWQVHRRIEEVLYIYSQKGARSGFVTFFFFNHSCFHHYSCSPAMAPFPQLGLSTGDTAGQSEPKREPKRRKRKTLCLTKTNRPDQVAYRRLAHEQDQVCVLAWRSLVYHGCSFVACDIATYMHYSCGRRISPVTAPGPAPATAHAWKTTTIAKSFAGALATVPTHGPGVHATPRKSAARRAASATQPRVSVTQMCARAVGQPAWAPPHQAPSATTCGCGCGSTSVWSWGSAMSRAGGHLCWYASFWYRRSASHTILLWVYVPRKRHYHL